MDTTDQPGTAPGEDSGRHRHLRRLTRVLGSADPLPIDPDLAPDDTGAPSPSHRARAPHLRRARPGVLAAIAVGGFAGTLARYEVGLAWPDATGHFPTATFTINTSGALLLGIFLAAAIERRRSGPYLRPLVATGLLGGWTTYSTLAVESVALVRAGHSPTALAYLGLSLVAGLVAAALGIALGRVHRPAAVAPAGPSENDGGVGVIVAAVVGIAGALGAVLRYLADGAVEDRISGPFPWGTLVVNVSGSFVLGVITGLLWYHGLAGHDRAVLGVGFCGGFTTWSTASWESVRLAESGLFRQAATFTFGGLVAALAAAALGIILAAAL